MKQTVKQTVALITDAPYYLDFRAQRTVEALLSEGIQVSIVDQGMQPSRSRDEALPGVGVFSSPIPPEGFKRLLWHMSNKLMPCATYKRRIAWIGAALTEINPDSIHCVNVFALEAATDYAQAHHIPLVYEPYEFWPEHLFSDEYNLSPKLACYLAEIETKALNLVDYLISVSPRICAWYEARGAIRTEVIFNVPDSTNVSDRPSEVHHPLRLVHSGNLVKNRNVALLLKALTASPDVTLAIQGGGDERAYLSRLSEQLGLDSRVNFRTSVAHDTVVDSLHEYDIGISALLPDSCQTNAALPNKIFDYMAAGLGFVAFKTAALSELPDIETFSVLVDELSAEGLAVALQELACDPERLLLMKQAALRASKRYTPQAQKEKLRVLYRQLFDTALTGKKALKRRGEDSA